MEKSPKHAEVRPVRITRTISIRPDQDIWVTNVTEGGNVSRFMQAMLDAAMAGAFDLNKLQGAQGSGIERAMTYLKAKEAGIMFEEDVAQVIQKWAKGRRGVSVTRNKLHPEGVPFVSDFWVEHGKEPLFSVACKSSSRDDRLQLALGEAIIGVQRTGRPVITVVPYFLDSGQDSRDQFKALKLPLVELAGLPAALDAATK